MLEARKKSVGEVDARRSAPHRKDISAAVPTARRRKESVNNIISFQGALITHFASRTCRCCRETCQISLHPACLSEREANSRMRRVVRHSLGIILCSPAIVEAHVEHPRPMVSLGRYRRHSASRAWFRIVGTREAHLIESDDDESLLFVPEIQLIDTRPDRARKGGHLRLILQAAVKDKLRGVQGDDVRLTLLALHTFPGITDGDLTSTVTWVVVFVFRSSDSP